MCVFFYAAVSTEDIVCVNVKLCLKTTPSSTHSTFPAMTNTHKSIVSTGKYDFGTFILISHIFTFLAFYSGETKAT